MRQVESRKGRSGFTLIELLVVVAIIALLISILLPSLARARELAKRTACAANMSGIGKGLHTYASEGNQGMPISMHVQATADNTNANMNWVGAGGSKRGRLGFASDGDIPGNPVSSGATISTIRNLWTLVRAGGSTPGSFVCPSSEDAKNDEDSPQDYWDFGKGDNPTEGINATQAREAYKQCSYGYQVPYGLLGKPTAEGDQRNVLSADKGPYSIGPDGGQGTSVPNPANPPTTLNSASSSDDWRKYNSPNHGGIGDGEGQNVLYADSHAEWNGKPIAGPALDNIYTQWGAAGTGVVTLTQRMCGTAPNATNKITPWGLTDGLIYP
ncbi:MAG: hypothetical protein AMXMBFR83_17890 [Phycisphaerae bacterium]